MTSFSIITKLDTLPDNLKQEVVDFIHFLSEKSKVQKIKNTAKFGSAKGLIKMAPDFDEPLEDFKEYM